jgi:molybdate transport system substrate-binding protein
MCRNWSARAVAVTALFVASALVGMDFEMAAAAEVKVLSAAALKSSLDDLAGNLERRSGLRIMLNYGTAGDIKNRIQRGGESVDVTILSKPRMDELVQQGKVNADSVTKIASAAVGVAVRAGAPKPDISSSDALKRSLLAAKSISYTDPAKGGTSGIHFLQVLEQLGIAEEMKSKTILAAGGRAPDLVARGEAEIGVTMVPEILSVTGVDFVGSLPQELQNTTDFVYLAGIVADSKEADAARAFIQFISGPIAAPIVKSKGLDPS